MSTFPIRDVKKKRKFGGKVYTWHKYIAMKTEAARYVEQLRQQGKSARVVAQPGYGQGGWSIYVRG